MSRSRLPVPWRRAGLALCLLCFVACGSSEPLGQAVTVDRLLLDPDVGAPVVLLREVEGRKRVLPIWIGPGEANSIEARLQGRTPPRPNSHDLAKRLVDRLDGSVLGIVVTDLRAGVYYASVRLGFRGEHVDVDARPSDAIALALRYDAPIFVRELVFELSQEAARDRQVPSLRL
ncbi:MAG: bifunctional nuclease family protein [Myxococcota bacterium]